MEHISEEFNVNVVESVSYKAYDIVKTMTWVYLIHFIVYSMLLLFNFTLLTVPIFLCGMVTLIIMLIRPLNNIKNYFKDSRIKNEVKANIITQIVVLSLDIILGIFLSLTFDSYLGIYVFNFFAIYFVIMHYVRYLAWGYAIFSINLFHTYFANKFSYKNRFFIVGNLLYLFIGLKLIVFNFDFNLLLYSKLYTIGKLGTFFGNYILLLVLQIVYLGFNLVLLLESTIKFQNVSSAIKTTQS